MNVRPPPPEDRRVWIEKQSFQLADLEEEMEKLQARVESAEAAEAREKEEAGEAGLRARAKDQLRDLVVEARRRLDALRGSSDDAWHELRGGFEEALEDLRSAVLRAREALERD